MKLVAKFVAFLAVLGTAQAAEEEIDIGFIIEPTASHISGYLDVLAERTGVRTVAVAVDNQAALANAKEKLGDRFHGNGFSSAETMLAEVKPKLTVVTMEGVNAPVAIKAALDAGSHVLTEKPSCVKLEHFEELAQIAEKRDLHLMLAMATRAGSPLKKARQLIADGVIGKPYSVSMIWIADQTRLTKPAYHESWLADPVRAGGGKLIYHGVHYLDVIQQLLDDPIVQINGFTNNVGGQPIDVEDSAVASFKFASGVTGVHNTGYYLNGGKQSEIRIWGSDGWLRLAHLEGEPLEWFSTKQGAPKEVQKFEYDDRLLMYHQFFQEAIDAIRANGEPPITTAESLQALRVVFAAYRAVETGETQNVRQE